MRHVKIAEDLRIKYKDGKEFSSRKLGFVVVESLSELNTSMPPLQIGLHNHFLFEFLKNSNKCMWLSESSSSNVLKQLEKTFPEHNILNNSIAGCFSFDQEKIQSFWSIFAKIDHDQPWENEQAWAIAGVKKDLAVPIAENLLQRPFWSVEHVFKYPENLDCIFVQRGWFAFFAFRPSDVRMEMLYKEFPELNVNS